MTNHYTQFLEKTFGNDILEAGLQLFEKGAVTSLVSGNASPITAIVNDGKSYEIEVHFPFDIKQKAQCSCSTFSRLGTCRHITAALYKIMHNSNSDTSYPGNQFVVTAKTPQPAGALHTGQILDILSIDELKAFVKQYARMDRKFDLQLKAAFATKIDWEDNTEKYRRILNNIVPPNTASKPRLLSKAELKLAMIVLDTFAGQINDAIALEQYRTALNQFEPSFSKILYLYAQNPQFHNELTPLLKAYHDITYSFLMVKLPPELRGEFMSLMIDFGNRSYYLHTDLLINLLYGMEPFLRKAERHKVEASVLELIASRPNNQKVILLAILLSYTGKFTTSVFQIFKENHISYVEVADTLLKVNQITVLASMLDYLQSKGISHKELQHRQLLVYSELKDFESLGKAVKRLFTETGDVKYLALLKEVVPRSEYAVWCTEIEFTLLKTGSDSKNMITFYTFEKNWPGLLIFLERLNNPEILMEHDAVLFREEKDAVTDLWKGIISQQVSLLKAETYASKGISGRIAAFALHLRSQKLDSIRRKAHKMLVLEHPELTEIHAYFA